MVAGDLMPLVKQPQRPSATRAAAPSYVAARPARPADPAPLREAFPVLPLFLNAPVFVYADVVSKPAQKKK